MLSYELVFYFFIRMNELEEEGNIEEDRGKK